MISKSAVMRASLIFDCGVPSPAGMAVERCCDVARLQAPSLEKLNLIAKLRRPAQMPRAVENLSKRPIRRILTSLVLLQCNRCGARHSEKLPSLPVRTISRQPILASAQEIGGSGAPRIARRSGAAREAVGVVSRRALLRFPQTPGRRAIAAHEMGAAASNAFAGIADLRFAARKRRSGPDTIRGR